MKGRIRRRNGIKRRSPLIPKTMGNKRRKNNINQQQKEDLDKKEILESCSPSRPSNSAARSSATSPTNPDIRRGRRTSAREEGEEEENRKIGNAVDMMMFCLSKTKWRVLGDVIISSLPPLHRPLSVSEVANRGNSHPCPSATRSEKTI
ncbi:unnamed protein product [Nesidiocoris tenuis]|uniref:Uncharacterized protein n=1 Tax=Nesidiocoris tenuis TaxID=355587 RepID=A0A6H5HP33_9HEMI|nr:unnamed protein product [Nesidiocoris tenuis]